MWLEQWGGTLWKENRSQLDKVPCGRDWNHINSKNIGMQALYSKPENKMQTFKKWKPSYQLYEADIVILSLQILKA